MSVDCSSLIGAAITPNITSNNTLSQIWLDNIWYGTFAPKFWTPLSFSFGLIITILAVIAIAMIIACIYYPRYDKAQKLLKLKILEETNIPRQNAKELLLPHIDEDYISELIMDYADITLDINDDNLDEMMISKINDKPITNELLYKKLIWYMAVTSLLILSYIGMYHFIVHINDSYKSYIETECFMIENTTNCRSLSGKGGCNQQQSEYYIDMTPICDPDTIDMDKYQFRSRLDIDYDESSNPCWINKDDFSVRLTTGNSRCCCKEEGRCSQNGVCPYCLLVLGSIIAVGTVIWLFRYRLKQDLVLGYVIEAMFGEDRFDARDEETFLLENNVLP